MGKLHKVELSALHTTDSFKVLELNEAGLPKSVQRFPDHEVFSIGDYVTNGTKMKGNITGFEAFVPEGGGKLMMYVNHTWSGVGMYLENLSKITEDEKRLPSAHQHGDEVWLCLWSAKIVSEVYAVHFYEGKVKYDLTVFGGNGESTRIYNVDSAFVTKHI